SQTAFRGPNPIIQRIDLTGDLTSITREHTRTEVPNLDCADLSAPGPCHRRPACVKLPLKTAKDSRLRDGFASLPPGPGSASCLVVFESAFSAVRTDMNSTRVCGAIGLLLGEGSDAGRLIESRNISGVYGPRHRRNPAVAGALGRGASAPACGVPRVAVPGQ